MSTNCILIFDNFFHDKWCLKQWEKVRFWYRSILLFRRRVKFILYWVKKSLAGVFVLKAITHMLYKSIYFSFISDNVSGGELHTYLIAENDGSMENYVYGHLVLVDFGLSKEMANGRSCSPRIGTLECMAPELLRDDGNGHNFSIDWWLTGVLFYELLTGCSPFNVLHNDITEETSMHLAG